MIETKAAAAFTFDEEKHLYLLDGRRLESVTEVLEDNGFIDTEWYTEDSRRRGLDVHYLSHFYDENDYDQREAERRGVAGYIESWRKFREKCGFKIMDIEPPLFHPLLRYGGRPDRRALWTGWEWIFDIKSGPPEKWHGFQTAAYDPLFGPYSKGLRKRAGVHLHADGRMATLVPHEDINDGAYFNSFLTTTRIRRLHGIGNGIKNH